MKAMSNEETTLYRLGRLEEELAEVKKIVSQVHDKVISTPACPSPGMCINLQSIQHRHSDKIAALERWQSKMVGAILILVPLCSIFGPHITKLIFK